MYGEVRCPGYVVYNYCGDGEVTCSLILMVTGSVYARMALRNARVRSVVASVGESCIAACEYGMEYVVYFAGSNASMGSH